MADSASSTKALEADIREDWDELANDRKCQRLAARANFDVLVAGRRSTRPLERYARLFDDWLTSGNALCGNRLVRLPCICGCTEVWLS